MSEVAVEEWLYAGQRLDKADKPYSLWIDPSGEEMVFRKLSGGMPGQAYTVEVDRTGESLSVTGTPRYRGELATRQATEAQLESWRAEDKAARQALESKRLEKALAGTTEIEQALETLRRHRARLRSYAKKGAFTTYVIGELERPPQKETDRDD